MRRTLLAALACLVFLAVQGAQAQTIKYLNALTAAGSLSDTDTWFVCQNAAGCGAGIPTVRATSAQINAYIASKGYAPLASPAFTGTPTAPTPPANDNSTRLATTAWVQGQAYAPLTSPVFLGTPLAPTPPGSDNSTRLATTAFVQNQGYAPLASPAFTGTPTAPTAVQATNSTQIATTAFVKLQQQAIPISWLAGFNPNTATGTTVNQAWTVQAIVGRVEVPLGAAGTVSIYKAPNGTACGAGGSTILHSGSFNANGTAATLQTLTVTTATLAPNDTVCVVTTGGSNWTSGSSIGNVTVFVTPS